jgi:CheY-like chemotaxis protein
LGEIEMMIEAEIAVADGGENIHFSDQETPDPPDPEVDGDDPERQDATPKRKPIKSILVVDDQKNIRDIFREALEQLGYTIRVASDGNEGLKLFIESPSDLIITDIFMPEKDGHAFIYDILQEFPDTRIIAITGFKSPFGMDTELNIAESLGAKRVFIKPVKLNELVKAIKELEFE